MSALLSSFEIASRKAPVPVPVKNPNVIPPMTHHYGQHWPQPDTSEILIDDTHAIMPQRVWDALSKYNTSMPTGVYDGKMWGWEWGGRRQLRWYGYSEHPDRCHTYMREALIV